jgi:hypothetical protein
MARARLARVGLTGPRPDLTMTGRCRLSCSAGSSKTKIRTSSRHKPNLALGRDEVRILIFDDPAEQERQKCLKFCFSQLDSTNGSIERTITSALKNSTAGIVILVQQSAKAPRGGQKAFGN